MDGVTMATILADVGTFFTQSITWVTTLAETIVSDPFLTLTVVCMPVAGFAIGAISRLKRL